MRSYETEQKKLITALLMADPDRFYTVEEIAQILKGDSEDEKCSVSTVYRVISRLCEEGIVHKYARDTSRKFSYRYVKGAACGSHLHLKCDACGKLFHMDDNASTQLLKEVMRHIGFSVDGARTVMPGVCAACRSAGESS